MKKKGFTLIELLATIVILAVIALIATPIILGVINKAEQNAFKNSVYGVYDAIDYYYTINLDQTGLDKEFDFSKTVPLNYKGEKMVSGKITIDEKGNKIVSFVTNGEYCANGKNNDIKVSDDCIKLDETASEIDKNKIRTIATTNSITVILGEGFAVDNESGIKDYEYIIKKDNKEISKYKTTDETYTFEGLSHNTEYEITIKVTNKNNKVNEVTVEEKTEIVIKPTMSYTDMPGTLQNGYLKSQKVIITYTKGSVTNPTYYVKTSRAGTSSLAVTKSCGTGTNPGTCSAITSTTSLAANTWYVVSGNVSVTYSIASETTGTIYAAVGDGTNLSETLTGTIDKIDTTSPSVTLSTPTTSTNAITIPITSSDSESGLGTATCKYSTTSGSYTTAASSVSTTSCSLTGLTKGTTYYYQVCIPDKVGNTATCKTGSAITGTPTKPTIAYTNTPSTLQNGYLKKQVAKVTYTKGSVTSPTYYVKTTRAGTSSLAVTKSCGTGTNPGTCSTITSTTSLTAGTWYVVSGNVSITYSTAATSTGTIYAAVADNTGNFSETLSGTIDKIDTASPSVTLGTPTTSSNSITIPITSSDEHSGLGTATCKYSTTSGSYTTAANSVSTTSCSLTGLTKGTTYYYQVCIPDKVGNEATCKTGSAKTGTPSKPTIAYTNTPSTLQNGYLKKQVATVTYTKGSVTSPTYYVKTTRAGTGSLSGTPCGTGTNPGTCSGTATTSYASNTWYKVSGNVSITYSSAATSTGTIYAAVADSTGNFSETLTGTIDKIDTTSPEVSLGTASKTSNTITIPITSSDAHSGVGTITCKYSTTSGSYTTNASSVSTTGCGLTGLAENTTYYYQICVSDKVGNTAPCKTGSATTKVTLAQPSFAVYSNNPTTAVNGYYKTRQVKVTYTKPSSITGTVNYYIKSTVNATSNTTLTYICGNGTEPGTCTSTSTTSMTAGYWYYQTTSTTPIITETTNGTLYAKIKYSDSASLNGTYAEGNIDSTGPGKPTITLYTGSNTTATAAYTSGTWTTANVMTRSQSTDSQSGIQKYQYSHDGVNWSEGYTSWTHTYSSDKTTLDYWITWEGQWNFYIRAIDNLGNVGPASDMFTLRIVKCTNKTISSYGGWGACSKSCGTGSRSRTINYVSSIKTDHSCGTGTQSENCNTQACCSSTKIGSYGNWSACSKSCGTGTRSRTVYYVSNYDGSSCGTTTQTENCNTHDCCSKTVLKTDAGLINLSNYSTLTSDIQSASSDMAVISTSITVYPSLANLQAGTGGSNISIDWTSAGYGFNIYYTKHFVWEDGKLKGKKQMTYCVLSYYDGKLCSAINTKSLGQVTIKNFGTTNTGKVQMDQANAIVASVNNASTNGYPLFAWSSLGTPISTITNSSGTVFSGFPGGTWDICGKKYGTR